MRKHDTNSFIKPERVVQFFLELYKLELKATKLNSSSCGFRPLSTKEEGPDSAYELRVMKHGIWKARRMSIGLLGEETGSKSTCYKVVYGDVLVLKIPSPPITNFFEYIANIKRDRQISNLLSPDIQCVTPGVADILARVPYFFNKDKLPWEEYETQCLNLLEADTSLQAHLKIDGAFIFFMALSKSSFISQVLEKMHKVDDRVDEEMDHYMGALNEFEMFERVYGKNNAAVFFDLNDIWSNYERWMDRFLAQQGVTSSIPAYRMKEWLRIHLAGGMVNESDTDLPSNAMRDLNALLRKIVRDNRQTFETYRSVVRARFRRESFIKNRSLFKGIVTNILRLLHRLKNNGVAARDLKPDNIFIAAVSKTPHLQLSSVETYSMGLIDLETAVNFLPLNEVLIKQPLLSGTPSYATPGHLFENDILFESIGDLSRVLYLQDWHSAYCIIYLLIVGEHLFDRTSRLFPEIISIRSIFLKKKLPLIDVFKYSNKIFWDYAKDEFAGKIEKSREKLRSVGVLLSNKIRMMLGHELLNVKNIQDAVISECVFTQDMFKSDKSRERLITCPRIAITKIRMNWENGATVPNAPPVSRKRIIHFLGSLEKLKQEAELHVRMLKLLVQKQTELTVLDLLELMFAIVHRTMHQCDGNKKIKSEIQAVEDAYAYMNEKTILIDNVDT